MRYVNVCAHHVLSKMLGELTQIPFTTSPPTSADPPANPLSAPLCSCPALAAWSHILYHAITFFFLYVLIYRSTLFFSNTFVQRLRLMVVKVGFLHVNEWLAPPAKSSRCCPCRWPRTSPEVRPTPPAMCYRRTPEAGTETMGFTTYSWLYRHKTT